MIPSDLLLRASDLRARRTPFVLATVVRAQRPTSAKAGDSALVLADGTLDGFVGGTCAEATVCSLGLRLLATGESTLLRITPSAGADVEDEGSVTVANPCLSGGALDIFMEPMLPPPLVHVLGDAPVARALVALGGPLGYQVDAVTDPAAPIPPDAAAVVVASHGHDEEPVLAAALRAGVPYVALVASRRRGSAVLSSLDVDAAAVHSPAGLDIGARTAPEVALSILAEIVASRPRAAPPPPVVPPSASLLPVLSPLPVSE
ncbi:XdhC family protein [Phytohabitans sp. ZYX-F-186]|uniref:XdhC family protein n=1 Tax=Phytohabitans maris TaxID=3071409 RepID=A0ABU0ZP04_9ACTN|nr:XdhC family protein [Phytohabitans sp. ZYX-F-186]MDQ7908779.1 XdhC family protein [Phytohabitans sp. ZYX-F-186]